MIKTFIKTEQTIILDYLHNFYIAQFFFLLYTYVEKRYIYIYFSFKNKTRGQGVEDSRVSDAVSRGLQRGSISPEQKLKFLVSTHSTIEER